MASEARARRDEVTTHEGTSRVHRAAASRIEALRGHGLRGRRQALGGRGLQSLIQEWRNESR